MGVIRKLRTEDLSSREVTVLRALFRSAWSDDSEAFTDEDWEHARGGVHFLAQDGRDVVSHASVVKRELETNVLRLTTGYVEAVATAPTHERRGHGSAVMRAVGRYIDATFPLGALNTGRAAFYQRLGWVLWNGPTFVRTDTGPVRTPEEDGYVLVRLTPTSPELDLSQPISCDWRPGDVW